MGSDFAKLEDFLANKYCTPDLLRAMMAGIDILQPYRPEPHFRWARHLPMP